MNLQPWPTDVHLIDEWEDIYHVESPKCPCRPRFVGFTTRNERVFEHSELDPIH